MTLSIGYNYNFDGFLVILLQKKIQNLIFNFIEMELSN